MAVNIVSHNAGEIVQMNSARLNDLADKVLEYMALNGFCTGSIIIGSGNPIGTFTDTVRAGGVGSSNTTILSTTYTLSQVMIGTLAVSDPPYYIGLDYSTNPSQIVLKENITTLNDVADYILNRAVTVGPFCYYLGTNAPVDGGTWLSLGTLSDTLEGFSVTVNTYHLWKKISNGSYGSVNPMKLVNGELKQYSESEILSLAKIVEQRIISTGIGTYVLQTSIPGTGTWSNVGSILDIRRTTSGTSYLGVSPVSYEGLSPISYGGVVYADYLGPAPATYVGTTSQWFSGPAGESYFVGPNVPTNFAGPGTETIFDSPISWAPVIYTGIWPPGTAFYSPIQGFDGGQYLGIGENAFQVFYSGGGVTYMGISEVSFTTVEGFSQSYQGTVTQYYQGIVPGGSYLGTVYADFLGTAPANFFGSAPDSQYFSSPIPTNYDSTTATYYDGVAPTEYSVGQTVNSSTETISTITLYKRIG